MLQQIDNAVLHFFGSVQTPILNELMIFISALGNAGLIWIAVSIIMLCFKRTRRSGATMAVALIIGLVVCNITLKPLIARTRPFDAHDIELLIATPTGFSFPSGHSVSSLGAGMSAFLTLKKRGIPFLLLAILIAVSRLYLQVHYLSDVLAGSLLGCIFAVAANLIVNRKSGHISKAKEV